MDKGVIDWEVFLEMTEAAEKLEDAEEREARLKLLEAIRRAAGEYDMHVRECGFKELCRDIKGRGARFAPAVRSGVMARWSRIFAAPVPRPERDRVYFGQHKWHLFSYGLLPALSGREAAAAFEAQPKDSALLFFQHMDQAFCVEGAGHIRASDFAAGAELGWADAYLFDPVGKWTYVHTHEECCGPYFYKLI